MSQPTLEEMAMKYAFIDLDVVPTHINIGSVRLRYSDDEWELDNIRRQMDTLFGCYETQEAIKEAVMAVKLLGLEKKDDGHGDY
jgi:hypothetical protein